MAEALFASAGLIASPGVSDGHPYVADSNMGVHCGKWVPGVFAPLSAVASGNRSPAVDPGGNTHNPKPYNQTHT